MATTEILPDDDSIRLARRRRVLAEMEADGVDILVVGREANARYVSGAPRLWTAGSREFGPGCVLVRDPEAVYLLSTWDEGVPEDIPHENLYGISFNSATFLKVLSEIDGAATARTVATDGLTPGSSRLLPKSFPAAEIVDGERLMRRARQVKTPEEIDAIRASVGIAERALAEAESALKPGATERQLTGIFMEAMAAAGVTTPSNQDVVWVTSPDDPWRRAGRDAPIAAGDLVAFEAGVILDGYVGEVGRTHVAGDDPSVARELLARRDALWDQLVDRCRPGVSAADLLSVYDDAGVGLPPMPVARGLGLGFDLPVVTPGLAKTAAAQLLEAGMVFSLTACVWQPGVGTAFGQDPVVVTDGGPEVLSSLPFRHREG